MRQATCLDCTREVGNMMVICPSGKPDIVDTSGQPDVKGMSVIQRYVAHGPQGFMKDIIDV